MQLEEAEREAEAVPPQVDAADVEQDGVDAVRVGSEHVCLPPAALAALAERATHDPCHRRAGHRIFPIGNALSGEGASRLQRAARHRMSAVCQGGGTFLADRQPARPRAAVLRRSRACSGRGSRPHGRRQRAASTGEVADLFAQNARVNPPLEPAKRELTTLLKIDPNE